MKSRTDFACTSVLLAATAMILVAASQPAYGVYDPKHGRWLQRDPLGVTPVVPRGRLPVYQQFADGANLHQFVGSRPTVLVDPEGTTWDWCYMAKHCAKPQKPSSPKPTIPWGTIDGPHDALVHYLLGCGETAKLSDGLLANLMLYDFYSEILHKQIPDQVRAMLPKSCCQCPTYVSASGARSPAYTAPIDYVLGYGWGKEVNYSFNLNNAIGTINSVRWTVTCLVGTQESCSLDGCTAFARDCKAHFTLDDIWTFNTGWKDWVFQKVFGNFMGGQEFPVHNEWDEVIPPQSVTIAVSN